MGMVNAFMEFKCTYKGTSQDLLTEHLAHTRSEVFYV